ncbi:hypothetical protein Nmel_011858 [Mimus melanotis]
MAVQDFLCFLGFFCCTLARLKLILCGCPNICNSLAHSKATCVQISHFRKPWGSPGVRNTILLLSCGSCQC